MLISLHVKNLALIAETEVNFGEGLNILSGETGAGKSIIIGSLNLALGEKVPREMLRENCEYALVELVFTGSAGVREKLESMDLEAQDDDTVIISRKMQPGKSICRINGETVTAKQVKELAESLIDIHGQHDHQSLLHKKKHLEILDSFCDGKFRQAAQKVEEEYRRCRELQKTMEEETMDEEAKAREQSLAEFEWGEIQEANLIPGEDEELEQRYRLMVNSKRILESLAESYQLTGNEMDGAGSALSRALRSLRGVTMYDGRLEELEGQLSEIDSLLADYNRDVAEYMADCEFDEGDYGEVEERLNVLNRLKGKYGGTINAVIQYGQERQQLLDKLADYEVYMQELERELSEARERLMKACEKLSAMRKKNAAVLTGLLKDALVHLNFLTVKFEISINRTQNITATGFDDVEFMISTNPGEPLKSLGNVASGGELSRIMLAIKTVLASRDRIPTMIFDEIDTGISGKTAWKVSEKLGRLSQSHQIICITHLPQIAAMADDHYKIAKQAVKNKTVTDIVHMEETEAVDELARMLGSDEITDTVRENARELIATARKKKV